MNIRGMMKWLFIFFIFIMSSVYCTSAMASYQINLNTGWNLISLPEQPGDTDISNVTDSIEGKFESIWAYLGGAWFVYYPADPASSTLATMTSGVGYWVNMTESGSLSGSGTGLAENYILNEGLNLIGVTGSTEKSVTEVLATIEGDNISIWGYVNSKWQFYSSAKPNFSDLTTLKPGYGYWISVSNVNTLYNEEKTRAVIESFESGDTTAIQNYVSADTFIQHNLSIQDGRQGLIDAVNSGFYSNTTVEIVRLFSDGNYVVTHSDYTLSGARKVVFDVFRFQDGIIVEHWDNYQDWAGMTYGTTMLDGPTAITDLGSTGANKTLVQGFAQTCLVDGQWSSYTDYIDQGVYTQHNPNFDSGTSWIEALSDGTSFYEEIKYVFGQGNFVLVISYNANANKAVYDMWRVESNRIVEHWDVVEIIPPAGQWANSNGKF